MQRVRNKKNNPDISYVSNSLAEKKKYMLFSLVLHAFKSPIKNAGVKDSKKVCQFLLL